MFFEQGQGFHRRSVSFAVRLEIQDIQQYGHDAAIVVAIRGACHQLYLLLLFFVGFGLTNDVLERFLADDREDNFPDHTLGPPGGGLGQLV